MSCDVGEVTKSLENEQSVGEATEGLESPADVCPFRPNRHACLTFPRVCQDRPQTESRIYDYILDLFHSSSLKYQHIQGVNDIDCQKHMGDTSQSTYQKSLIQFCFISYFNFYVLKPDVSSKGTVRMFTINQLFGSLQLGNTRLKKKAAGQAKFINLH